MIRGLLSMAAFVVMFVLLAGDDPMRVSMIRAIVALATAVMVALLVALCGGGDVPG